MNIYLCGPTVYAEVHIGNLRPILTFDIFIRSLRYLNKEVFFIHNLTDIDDKIIEKAKMLNISEGEVSEKFIKLYLDELKTYNILNPEKMPKVTNNIDGMIDFISRLIKNKNAYVINESVYFDTHSLKDYGKLSNRSIETTQATELMEKKNNTDFALWKKTSDGERFDSPWGQGRPGWHTECSYFIEKYMGDSGLDIHGGGIDLLFPHHENENAQFEALHGKPISKTWKHIGHVMLDDKKMSKSLGNVFDSKAFANKFGADTLRFLYLTSSVTSPMNLKLEDINQAKIRVETFDKIFKKSQLEKMSSQKSEKIREIAVDISQWKFANALKNIYKIIKDFNTTLSAKSAKDIFEIMKLLGFKFAENDISIENKNYYQEWKHLKQNKEFHKADSIRDILIKNKII